MRVAALADVHGNLPALEAVLAEVEREHPDVIVFCGDVASGPMPVETIDVVRGVPGALFVRGNADRGLVDEFDGREKGPMPGPLAGWAAKQLDTPRRDFLASFAPTVTVNGVDGLGRVLFCHATPRNDTDVFTVETSDDRLGFLMSTADADVVVCGHTHMQFDRRVGARRIVNAGSVGMAYGGPGAYWVMLGPGVSLRRVDYDREEAAARMRANGAADADQFARDNVLEVPSVERAMEFMRAAEAKQIAAGQRP